MALIKYDIEINGLTDGIAVHCIDSFHYKGHRDEIKQKNHPLCYNQDIT